MTGYSLVKRVLDVLLATACLVLAAPLLLLAGLAIVVDDGQPILYRQRRVGKYGREFELLKLRTMRLNELAVTEIGQVGPRHALVTRVGSLLRRTKLDELPQLINVVRGDMSLVGPRPTVPALAAKYTSFQRRRLEVSPGMTGWAQVNGNVALEWEERIALDIWYIDHRSPRLDFQILTQTIRVVLFGETPNNEQVTIAKEHARRVDRSG